MTIEFGGVEGVKEERREMRKVNRLQDFAQDLRFGLRMLRKSPASLPSLFHIPMRIASRLFGPATTTNTTLRPRATTLCRFACAPKPARNKTARSRVLKSSSMFELLQFPV